MPRGRKPSHESERISRNPRLQFTEYPNVPYTGTCPDLPELEGGWSEETRMYWDAISTMPHCVDWGSGDWEFAIMTAVIHQRIVTSGSPMPQWVAELRLRELKMGTTMAGRLDLRIRYVNPETQKDEFHPDERDKSPNVTQIDKYRDMYG